MKFGWYQMTTISRSIEFVKSMAKIIKKKVKTLSTHKNNSTFFFLFYKVIFHSALIFRKESSV